MSILKQRPLRKHAWRVRIVLLHMLNHILWSLCRRHHDHYVYGKKENKKENQK